MKKIVLFFFAFLFYVAAYSQKKGKGGIDMLVAAGVQMPLGDFSSTHSVGVSLDLAPAGHWFKLPNKEKSKLPDRGHIAFTYNGGLTWYFGKTETTSGYKYKYPGYFFIHAYGGLFYNPVKKITASLLAGPALGIYNGNTRFNIGSRLESSYSIKGNLSAGPLINLMIEPGTDAIWSAGIKMTIDL